MASGEENAVRSTAAKALVTSYLRYDGATRSSITKAVLMVDHADSLALVAAQKKNAPPEQHAALDDLVARFQKSPLHR
jgi:hypothetical protein